MKICYIDEAGCCGALPTRASDIQPVLAICGVIIDTADLNRATVDFLSLKHRFYPGSSPANTTYLGRILGEIKGADLRRDMCKTRRKRRTATGFVNGVLDVCSSSKIQVVGRVWIKAPGRGFIGDSVYAKSLQDIASHFQNYLEETSDYGIIVADSRNASLNVKMSHSIFTKKFKSNGDDYSRIIDLPVFGHSANHAGIQISDLICSAIIFPVACWTYCSGHVDSVHIRVGYEQIKRDYMSRVQKLEYRYRTLDGSNRGGLSVSDGISYRSILELFQMPSGYTQSNRMETAPPLFAERAA